MPRLSKENRYLALGMLENGAKKAAVARHFGVSRVAIVDLSRRHAESGTPADRPRSGRPRVTTPQEDRLLVRESRKDRFAPARALRDKTNLTENVSLSTVRSRLYDAGLRGVVASAST